MGSPTNKPVWPTEVGRLGLNMWPCKKKYQPRTQRERQHHDSAGREGRRVDTGMVLARANERQA